MGRRRSLWRREIFPAIPALLILCVLRLGVRCRIRQRAGGQRILQVGQGHRRYAGGPDAHRRSHLRIPYPIEVQITLRDPARQGPGPVAGVGDDPGVPDGGPKATPFPGNYSYDFTIAEPGAYKFECYTTKDDDNYIIRDFTVGAAPGSPPPTIVAS